MRTLTAADALFIAVIICGAFASYNLIEAGMPDRVVVFRQNAVIAEYPLSGDAAFSVNGRIGSIGIEIKDGSARISHTDCPRKVCKLSGAISGRHGQLICAPNNVLVRIRSSNNNDRGNNVDAVAY